MSRYGEGVIAFASPEDVWQQHCTEVFYSWWWDKAGKMKCGKRPIMLCPAVMLGLGEAWNAHDASGLCLQPCNMDIRRNDSPRIDRDLLGGGPGDRWDTDGFCCTAMKSIAAGL